MWHPASWVGAVVQVIAYEFMSLYGAFYSTPAVVVSSTGPDDAWLHFLLQGLVSTTSNVSHVRNVILPCQKDSDFCCCLHFTETGAIGRAMTGTGPHCLPLASVKSCYGHTEGAAGTSETDPAFDHSQHAVICLLQFLHYTGSDLHGLSCWI